MEQRDIEENMEEPCIKNSIESYNKILFLEKMKTQRGTTSSSMVDEEL